MNRKFVISWINFFDNELHMERVDAADSTEAHRKALIRLGRLSSDIPRNGDVDVEELKIMAFNIDGMIGALEINDTSNN